MKEEPWLVTCRCGVTFDLRSAPWCHHEPIPTKRCPNGHCICHKLKEDGIWRPANPEEQAAGFAFMLKQEYGGKPEDADVIGAFFQTLKAQQGGTP